jgi:hypothetical protein
LDYTLFGWELITGNQKKLMIDKDTPYKLAEIIRDTWPGIYTFSGSDRTVRDSGKN